MTTITNHTEYTAAVNEAKLHDYRYFTLNAPTISDEQYDRLYFAIQDYETAHPDEVLADSPTQQCYSENGNGKRQVARRTACLSMKKIHDAKSMVKYLRTQQKACNLSNAVIDVEWKFDGDTVALVYLNGRLAEATYGHGKELMGNDCMDHIKHVQGVPQIVTAWHDLDRVEVRGEVIINNDFYARYTKAGKSQRSTVSSIMGKKVAVANDCMMLEFRPFRVIGIGQSNREVLDSICLFGFMRSGHFKQFTLTADLDAMEQIIEDIVCEAENIRYRTLHVPTDGLVFKFDNYEVYDMIGTTDHDAKYNAAFKFRPVHKAVTTYRGYHTTIGEKTGKVTYIADYDMVVLNGIECSNANCGSEQTFLAKNLKPGCKVQVSLHGDVTPHIDYIVNDTDTPVTEAEKIEATTDTADLTDASVEEEIISDNSRSEEESAQSVPSVVEEEEDIDDSEPIPYTAPEVTERPVIAEPICAPIITPERNHRPTSQQGTRRAPKRNYRMVGEPRTRVATATVSNNSLPTGDGGYSAGGSFPTGESGDRGFGGAPWIAYVFAALAVIALVVLLFAGLGAAVFFIPLLAGAFK